MPFKRECIFLMSKVTLLWALTVITQSELVKKTKEYAHCECDLYTRHPITTSHWRTEAHIVRQPQLLWGRQSFCISPSSVRKRIWYWFPQTLTHSCSWVPHHIPHPCSTSHPPFPQLACPSHSHPPSYIYPAHALFYPSLWSSKLPMLRSWKHLYIYSISTLLPPRQAVLCIFHLQGWMTYILSLAPCSNSSPLLHSVLLLLHWPQAVAVGVAARLN